MDFLNKLYDSNYFGIGLFAVISFLVVSFLIVLFFGKRDEKKRKLDEIDSKSLGLDNSMDTFKEVTPVVPVDVPVMQPEAPTPVAPINLETPVTPEVTPIPISGPVEPVNYTAPTQVVDTPTVSPIISDSVNSNFNTPIRPVIEEPVVAPIRPMYEEPTPIINEPVVPIVQEPIRPIIEEPTVTPIINNNVNSSYDRPVAPVQSKVMEPVRINIPEEPKPVYQEPVIKETPVNIYPDVKPIIEEPVINETYYRPTEKVEEEPIKVPNIDFDAIAKSISRELDELEQSSSNGLYDDVKVTSINDITSKPTTPNQFSSVYVTEPTRVAPIQNNMDMPKGIDLPTKKNDDSNY